QPFALMGSQTFIKPSATINLEPVISLDQRARFLNHLHELRRINEGDDTADSPGYSLNLVRVPVSVMPGKKTRKGHGAEISMTITPEYGEEFLPKTFRNLVMNDIKDMLGAYVYDLVDVVQTAKTAQAKADGAKAESGVKISTLKALQMRGNARMA